MIVAIESASKSLNIIMEYLLVRHQSKWASLQIKGYINSTFFCIYEIISLSICIVNVTNSNRDID